MNSSEDGWDGVVNEVPNPNNKMKIEGIGLAIDLNPIRL